MEASKQRSYNLGVQETKGRMTKELAGVYREYCQEVWAKALNLAKVPATLDLWRAENIYYLEDLREAFKAPLGLEANATPTATMPEQLPSPQVVLLPPPPPPTPEARKGNSKAGNQGRGVEVATGKEVGLGKAWPEDNGKGQED